MDHLPHERLVNEALDVLWLGVAGSGAGRGELLEVLRPRAEGGGGLARAERAEELARVVAEIEHGLHVRVPRAPRRRDLDVE